MAAEPIAVRIMTANVWGDYFGNPVAVREDQLLATFTQYAPDILGLQEMTPSWYGSRLYAGLQARYALAGMIDGSHENYVPLAYDKARFDLLAAGFERYLGTPDRSKAITYAVLRGRASGKVLGACNTHFWWKSGAEHERIRLENARQLSALMCRVQAQYHCPVFAFGDLNCTVASGVFQVLAEHGIQRLRGLAQAASDISSEHGDPVLGADGRYHGTAATQPDACSIDHILGLLREHPCRVADYQVVLDQAALDASDHSPVYADISL